MNPVHPPPTYTGSICSPLLSTIRENNIHLRATNIILLHQLCVRSLRPVIRSTLFRQRGPEQVHEDGRGMRGGLSGDVYPQCIRPSYSAAVQRSVYPPASPLHAAGLWCCSSSSPAAQQFSLYMLYFSQ